MIQNGIELKAAMQILYCTEIETFRELFPDHTPEWHSEKYDMMQKSPADFICYLDPSNIRILMRYLNDELNKNLPGRDL